jgi:Fic family protein
MNTELEKLVSRYRELGIDSQIDYDKFYLYSLITHSTAIEGSTITELENQIMFDQGISLKGKSIEEQNMNLDLKAAYEKALQLAKVHTPITIDMLKELSALVMKNTGKEYKTALGDFSSAKGDLRLLNVTAGTGGKSYMNYSKVPIKLDEFCTRLNSERANCASKSITDLYKLSFDSHYILVTIHPWADGNGRMARLIMNYIQFEFGLIPTKILKEDKEEYIKALVETREKEDLTIFRNFMTSIMIRNLINDIETYCKSIENVPESREKNRESGEKKVKSREKILNLLLQDNTLTAIALAERIGITPKAVEKQIAALKADGLLKRIGPDKGGHWQVVEGSSGIEVD